MKFMSNFNKILLKVRTLTTLTEKKPDDLRILQ